MPEDLYWLLVVLPFHQCYWFRVQIIDISRLLPPLFLVELRDDHHFSPLYLFLISRAKLVLILNLNTFFSCLSLFSFKRKAKVWREKKNPKFGNIYWILQKVIYLTIFHSPNSIFFLFLIYVKFRFKYHFGLSFYFCSF